MIWVVLQVLISLKIKRRVFIGNKINSLRVLKVNLSPHLSLSEKISRLVKRKSDKSQLVSATITKSTFRSLFRKVVVYVPSIIKVSLSKMLSIA